MQEKSPWTKLFIAAALIVLPACAPVVQYTVLKPPAIDLGNTRNIAVDNWLLAKQEPPPVAPAPAAVSPRRRFAEMALELLGQALGVGNRREASETLERRATDISPRLLAKLSGNAYYNLMEKGRPGVQALLVGAIAYQVSDSVSWREIAGRDRDGNPRRVPQYTASRRVEMKLDFRVVEPTSGMIRVAKHQSFYNVSTGQGSDEVAAWAKVTSENQMVDRMASQVLDWVVEQLLPQAGTEHRELEDGKTPALKTGNDYARQGMWTEAQNCWYPIVVDGAPAVPGDRLAAAYNTGVACEATGKLTEAKEWFSYCYQLDNNSRYLKAYQRVESRIAEEQRLPLPLPE